MAWGRGRGAGGWPAFGVEMCDVGAGRGLVAGTVSWLPLLAAARRASSPPGSAVLWGGVGDVFGLGFACAAAWPACGGMR